MNAPRGGGLERPAPAKNADSVVERIGIQPAGQ